MSLGLACSENYLRHLGHVPNASNHPKDILQSVYGGLDTVMTLPKTNSAASRKHFIMALSRSVKAKESAETRYEEAYLFLWYRK